MQQDIFQSVLRSRPTPHTVFYFISGVGIGIVTMISVIAGIGAFD